METRILFTKCFSKDALTDLYFKKIRYSRSVGLDKITVSSFENGLDSELAVINRKVINGRYHFTPYRQMLILKGAQKYPREISIATVRDRLVLTALNKFLVLRFGTHICQTPLPQIIIQDIINSIESEKFDCYLKFDIEHFYSSINHDKLFRIIRRTLRQKQAINLLTRAVETPTRSAGRIGSTKEKKCVGIPEGIPVSNILANIYLQDVDRYWENYCGVCYRRYVDDILILCKQENAAQIKRYITGQMKKLKLSFNSKAESGSLDKTFTYLGYTFTGTKVGVRASSVLHLEETLEKFLSMAKKDQYDNLQVLQLWKLNLRITGFVAGNKKYGWLFYFSQLNDIQLLYHLDWMVRQLFVRFGYKNYTAVKRFNRAYFELRYKLHNTTYIPNFDTYTLEQKQNLLTRLGIKFNPEETEREFHKLIVKTASELEKDVQSFS